MESEFMKDDPDEMKIAREASWLCNLFQEYNLNFKQKQKIIRSLIIEHKQKKINNGQT